MLIVAADLEIAETERGLAELTIACMRDLRKTDDEILKATEPDSKNDREYERDYYEQHGIRIVARRVKALMRRLLCN